VLAQVIRKYQNLEMFSLSQQLKLQPRLKLTNSGKSNSIVISQVLKCHNGIIIKQTGADSDYYQNRV